MPPTEQLETPCAKAKLAAFPDRYSKLLVIMPSMWTRIFLLNMISKSSGHYRHFFSLFCGCEAVGAPRPAVMEKPSLTENFCGFEICFTYAGYAIGEIPGRD